MWVSFHSFPFLIHDISFYIKFHFPFISPFMYLAYVIMPAIYCYLKWNEGGRMPAKERCQWLRTFLCAKEAVLLISCPRILTVIKVCRVNLEIHHKLAGMLGTSRLTWLPMTSNGRPPQGQSVTCAKRCKSENS